MCIFEYQTVLTERFAADAFPVLRALGGAAPPFWRACEVDLRSKTPGHQFRPCDHGFSLCLTNHLKL